MLRPFEQSDWYGFAGASNLPDGSEPRIGEIAGCWVLVSGTESGGACVELGNEVDEIWHKDFARVAEAFAVAESILSERDPPTTDAVVRQFFVAFERIN